MFHPTKFYPANIVNNGKPSLFTNHFDTAHEAKNSVQELIDNNNFGAKNHVLAGYAYFNKDGEIIYVFITKKELIGSLKKIKVSAKSGATRKYAALKDLKKTASDILNKLNHKKEAIKIEKVRTFNQFNGALNAILINERY